MTRTSLSIKNSIISLIAQFVTLVMQFLMQIVFVHYMSTNYLGANGLFTNLMSILSFAELGIGAAITFSLYEPIAGDDTEQVDAILTFYKKIYRTIGISILVFGGLMTLGLDFFVKSGTMIPHMKLMFFLYVLGTAVSYFYSYSRSMFIANQKSYVNTINQVGFKVLQNVLQITVLCVWHSYWMYLVLQIISNFFANWFITRRAKKDYPELTFKSEKRISPAIVEKLKKNVLGNVSNKIGDIVVNGTDNILLSKFLGLGVVGLYSNYILVSQGIGSIISQVMNAIVGTFGNIGVTESIEKQKSVYFQTLYLVALMGIVASSGFLIVIQPFIQFFFGSRYNLTTLTAFLIALNLGIVSLRKANLSFISALGLFWQMRYKALIESVVNLALSLFLVTQTTLGINGVLIGTILSNLLVNYWWEPLIIFKNGFEQSVGGALIRQGEYYIALVGFLWLDVLVIPKIAHISLIQMFFVGALTAVFTASAFVLIFAFQRSETKFFFRIVRKVIKI